LFQFGVDRGACQLCKLSHANLLCRYPRGLIGRPAVGARGVNAASPHPSQPWSGPRCGQTRLARNLIEHLGDWHRLSARIGMMQAINRHKPVEFDPKQKGPHWGKRKLKRINERRV
jgi:hypothetical protein